MLKARVERKEVSLPAAERREKQDIRNSGFGGKRKLERNENSHIGGNQEQYSVLLVSGLTGRMSPNEKTEKNVFFYCIYMKKNNR